MSTKTKHTSKPESNPYQPGSELALAFEQGWSKCYDQCKEMLEGLEALDEVIEGIRIRHSLSVYSGVSSRTLR